MKITTEDLGNRQVMLTVELDDERVDRALRGVARGISKNYNIPGFRRGRAPYNVILQRFGREALVQEALDDLGQEAIQEALESENLEPYDVGELQDVQLDPLTFKLRVPLRPIVDLEDYRELRIEPSVVEVDEESVDAELERLRQANAILEPADDRPAQMDDWVSLDVSANVDDESIVSREAYGMVLDAEDKEFELGFSEQIVDLKVGEEKQFTLTLGDNWGEGKAGQEASFVVTLGEVKSRTVPDLDDDLARTVGDFDTLEELRQNVFDEFMSEAQRQADQEYTDEAIRALIAKSTIEYPPDMIEGQIDDMIKDLETRLESQGIVFDDFLKLSGKTRDEFRESMRPQAEESAQRGLVLGALARMEKLDVAGAEIDEHIALVSAGWGESAAEAREALSSADGVRSIANSLLTDKVVQRLTAIVKGEAPPLEEDEQEPGDAVEEAKSGSEDISVEETSAEETSAEETSAEKPETSPDEVEESPVAEHEPDVDSD